MLNRRRSALFAVIALLLVGTGSKAAQAPRFERQLLGIRLMSRGIHVLRKYGSPSKVLVGNDVLFLFSTVRLPDKDFLTVDVTRLDGTGATGGTAGPYGPGAGPYGPGSGAYTPTPAPGIESGDTTEQRGRFVFWIYEYPRKGLTNIFALDEEGRVVAIGQAGGRASTKTARGVGIGTPYSDIVRRYGFPETHTKSTAQGVLPIDLLNVSFEESHGVQFFFINQQLRGYPKFAKQGPWCVGVVVTAVG